MQSKENTSEQSQEVWSDEEAESTRCTVQRKGNVWYCSIYLTTCMVGVIVIILCVCQSVIALAAARFTLRPHGLLYGRN